MQLKVNLIIDGKAEGLQKASKKLKGKIR